MDKRTKALGGIFRTTLLLVAIALGGLAAAYLALEFPPGGLIASSALLIGGLLIGVKLPEVTFALFLVAGFYKAEVSTIFPQFIDLTVLFGVSTALGVAIRIRRNQYKIPRIPNKFLLPYLGLVLMMLASLLYTSAPNYGIDKFLRFSIITAFAAFGPMFLFTDHGHFNRFSYTFIAIAVAGVLDACTGGSGRFHTAFGSNYIALSRIAGAAALLAGYYFLLASNLTKRLFWIITALISLFGLLYAGARGPVIALIVTIVVIFLLSVKWKLKKPAIRVIKGTVALVLVVGLLAVIYSNEFSTLISRTNLILPDGGLGKSATARLYDYDRAIHAMVAAPLFGQGVGGFSKYAFGVDARAYPHDVFLEIASELGIVGLALFLALIAFCFVQILRIRRESGGINYYMATVLLALFTFTLINAMVSGDVNDNRLFFAWIGTIYAFIPWSKKQCYAQ